MIGGTDGIQLRASGTDHGEFGLHYRQGRTASPGPRIAEETRGRRSVRGRRGLDLRRRARPHETGDRSRDPGPSERQRDGIARSHPCAGAAQGAATGHGRREGDGAGCRRHPSHAQRPDGGGRRRTVRSTAGPLAAHRPERDEAVAARPVAPDRTGHGHGGRRGHRVFLRPGPHRLGRGRGKAPGPRIGPYIGPRREGQTRPADDRPRGGFRRGRDRHGP